NVAVIEDFTRTENRGVQVDFGPSTNDWQVVNPPSPPPERPSNFPSAFGNLSNHRCVRIPNRINRFNPPSNLQDVPSTSAVSNASAASANPICAASTNATNNDGNQTW